VGASAPISGGRRHRLFGFLIALVALGSFSTVAPAAISVPKTYSWNGIASSDWTEGKNWTAFVAGGPGSGNIASFDHLFTGSWQPIVNADSLAGRLVFDSSLGREVTIGGPATLGLDGLGGIGLDNRQAGYAVFINAPIDVNNAQTWQISAAAGGALTVGGAVSLYDSALTLRPGNATGSLAVNGPIDGTGTITVAGAGLTTLSGKNTYTGGTALDSGTLRVANDSALGAGTLRIAGGTTIEGGNGDHTLANAVAADGDFTVGGNDNLTFAGAFDLGGNRTLTVDNHGLTTLAGVVSNAPAASFTKAGAGTLALAGDTTFTGGIAVTGGTLALNANDTLRSHANTVAVSSGATLAVAGGGISNTITALTGAGTANIAAGGTLVVNPAGAGTFSGTLAGSGLLVKQGGGTLTFANGTDAFSFNGTVTLDAGTLELVGGSLANHPVLGTLNLNGGTLLLSAAMLGVTTLNITGDTILDFGAGAASVLEATDIFIAAGKKLTVKNWTAETDFLFATRGFRLDDSEGTLAVYNATGSAPENLVTFNGGDGSDSAWLNYDYNGFQNRQIRPIPEPSAYGAIFLGGCLGLLGWRRRARRRRDRSPGA
jgi:autotransporter-associated beta strand protein